MMKSVLQKKTGLLYLLIVLFLPCMAHATVLGTVDLIYSGTGAQDSMTVWGGYYQGASISGGVSLFQKLDGTSQGKLWNNYDVLGVFCIELAEPLSSYPLTYDVIMPADGPRPTTFLGSAMGTTKAKYLQELWGRYYDPGWASLNTTSAQKSMAAVFSMAVWEIVHEEFTGSTMDWDVTVDGTPGNGGFAADYMYSSIANKWLHSLDGTGPMADLRVFSYDGQQDFLVAVPEPMTIILLSAGSLVMLKRKRVTY